MADTPKPTRLPKLPTLPVDPELAEMSARMTVLVENGRPSSLQDNLERGVGGTGGVFHYARHDGSMGRYIITNNHVVAAAIYISNADLPNGMAIQGQFYNVFYDHEGNPGLARLVSHNMSRSANDDGRADQGILQILDATHDREEMRAVLDKINPKLAQQFDQGLPVFSANPASSPLDLIQEPEEGLRHFQLSGYPGGIQGDAGLNRRDALKGVASIQQLETIAGTYAQSTPIVIALIPPNGSEFREGYSGSIVFDQETRRPVGILYAAHPDVVTHNGKEVDVASSLMPAAQEIRRIEAARARGEHVTVGIANTTAQGFASQTWAQNPYQLQPGLQQPPPVMLQLPSGVAQDPAPVSQGDLMTFAPPQAAVPLPRIEVKRDGEGR